MMKIKKGNYLVLIENGQLTSYSLDDKSIWEVGRSSRCNVPNIDLHSSTVSRKHGKFQNMDGIWFYVDYNGKNGTIYNHKYIDTGLKGRRRPIMLKYGDVFVFGGGKNEVINDRTIWGLFSENDFSGEWRTGMTKGKEQICFLCGSEKTALVKPIKGTVIYRERGIAIYMGDLTYLAGDISMTCL